MKIMWNKQLGNINVQNIGYICYRRVLGYYSGDDAEDALDMRKALPRDKHKRSMIPLDKPVLPEDLEW